MYHLAHPDTPQVEEASADVLEIIRNLNVDQFGRSLRNPKAIRAGIPSWHPRNDGEEEEEDDEEETEEEDEENEEDEEETSGKKGKSKGKKKEEDDDEDTSLPASEVARLRRIEREHKEAQRKAADEKKRADRKKAQEEGRWQDLINDAEKAKADAEKERDEAKAELVNYKFQVKVTGAASGLGFADPSDAHKFLADDFDRESDETEIQRALKKVLDKKPYLRGKNKASGNGGGGSNGKSGGTWTADDIRNMTSDEINANWNKPGFQEALAAVGQ